MIEGIDCVTACVVFACDLKRILTN